MIIAPSILSADFCKLGDAVDAVHAAGAQWIHVDVMDGAFVPNITIGQPVVASLKQHTTMPLDVHLMVDRPERYIADFISAGADTISVHVEATPHMHRALSQINDAGKHSGIAINPGTPIEVLIPCLHLVDLVVVMSVNPGFGGQAFIPETYQRVRQIRDLCAKLGRHTKCADGKRPMIEIDGGVSKDNAKQLKDAGADVLVAGSAIFGGGLEAIPANVKAIKYAVND